MTTTRDIIERAHRKIGVVASDEAMTADQASNGLNALNMMMHGWTLTVPTWSHSDTSLVAEFPMQAAFHEGVVYQLAARLAPDFVVPGFDPDQWFRAFQNYYLNVPMSVISTTIMRTPLQRWIR